jgi:aminoglycoside 3-N-acetyltransferase
VSGTATGRAVDGARLASAGAVAGEVVTGRRLVTDLRGLGVRPGQTVLVHASLRQVGWVDGGAPTVVSALREVLGQDGTLVAGAGTPENSMTSRTFLTMTEGLNRAQLLRYRRRMPAFDRETTPTSVGAVAEALRTTPGAVRSDHPQSSFAAVGREAAALMAGHRIRCHLGEDSPLRKLYDHDASVLLLGVGYVSCSAFHLAEYRYTSKPPRQTYSCVVMSRGKRRWLRYRDVVLDDSDFEVIGKYLEEELPEQAGTVGKASARLVPIRHLVDFATNWLIVHRW